MRNKQRSLWWRARNCQSSPFSRADRLAEKCLVSVLTFNINALKLVFGSWRLFISDIKWPTSFLIQSLPFSFSLALDSSKINQLYEIFHLNSSQPSTLLTVITKLHSLNLEMKTKSEQQKFFKVLKWIDFESIVKPFTRIRRGIGLLSNVFITFARLKLCSFVSLRFEWDDDLSLAQWPTIKFSFYAS